MSTVCWVRPISLTVGALLLVSCSSSHHSSTVATAPTPSLSAVNAAACTRYTADIAALEAAASKHQPGKPASLPMLSGISHLKADAAAAGPPLSDDITRVATLADQLLQSGSAAADGFVAADAEVRAFCDRTPQG